MVPLTRGPFQPSVCKTLEQEEVPRRHLEEVDDGSLFLGKNHPFFGYQGAGFAVGVYMASRNWRDTFTSLPQDRDRVREIARQLNLDLKSIENLIVKNDRELASDKEGTILANGAQCWVMVTERLLQILKNRLDSIDHLTRKPRLGGCDDRRRLPELRRLVPVPVAVHRAEDGLPSRILNSLECGIARLEKFEPYVGS